jgi:hypothetical protein
MRELLLPGTSGKAIKRYLEIGTGFYGSEKEFNRQDAGAELSMNGLIISTRRLLF